MAPRLPTTIRRESLLGDFDRFADERIEMLKWLATPEPRFEGVDDLANFPSGPLADPDQAPINALPGDVEYPDSAAVAQSPVAPNQGPEMDAGAFAGGFTPQEQRQEIPYEEVRPDFGGGADPGGLVSSGAPGPVGIGSSSFSPTRTLPTPQGMDLEDWVNTPDPRFDLAVAGSPTVPTEPRGYGAGDALDRAQRPRSPMDEPTTPGRFGRAPVDRGFDEPLGPIAGTALSALGAAGSVARAGFPVTQRTDQDVVADFNAALEQGDDPTRPELGEATSPGLRLRAWYADAKASNPRGSPLQWMRAALERSEQNYDRAVTQGAEIDPTGGAIAGVAGATGRVATDPLNVVAPQFGAGNVARLLPKGAAQTVAREAGGYIGQAAGMAAGGGLALARGATPAEVARDIEMGGGIGAIGTLGADVATGAARTAPRAARAIASNLTDTRLGAVSGNLPPVGSGVPIEEAAPPSRRFYHGTGSAFDSPDPGKFDPNGLFGPGYYLTDEPRVAGSYADVRNPVASHDETLQEAADTVARLERELKAARQRGDEYDIESLEESLDWERRGLEAHVARLPTAGPNVRAVDVPEGLRLLDVDEALTPQAGRELADAIEGLYETTPFPSGVTVRQWLTEHAPRRESTVEEALARVSNNVVYERGEAMEFGRPVKTIHPLTKQRWHDMALAAGYDGIRYKGGKRIPMKADDGTNIEHTAVVIFPESLPKIRNAISGQAGGITFAPPGGTAALTEQGLGAATGAIASQYGTDENTPLGERVTRAAIGAEAGVRGVNALRGRGVSGVLGIVPPGVAKYQPGGVALPTDDLFRQAVANTKGAEITKDGLRIDLKRFQQPQQGGELSVRTGVFYLPGDAKVPGYSTGKYGYGGPEKIAGETILRRPMFVKGATGGKAPESAFDGIHGKGAYEAMRTAALNAAGSGYHRPSYEQWAEQVRGFLLDHGFEDTDETLDVATMIVQTQGRGNTLPYAMQEAVVAKAVRDAGYDSVVGYSTTREGPRISEVFDLRESHYPTADGDYTLHDQFMPPGIQGGATHGTPPMPGPVTGGRAAIPAAMRGTAEQAAKGLPPGAKPITTDVAEEVERLRLPEMFPAWAHDTIREAAERIDFAKPQRRGVIAGDVAEGMADELADPEHGRTIETWIKESKAGKAYNGEELRALKNAILAQADTVRTLDTVLANPGKAGDDDIARAFVEGEKLAALVRIFEGGRAEWGRAGHAFQNAARSVASPAEITQRIFTKVGGRDNALLAVKEYNAMVAAGANPIQMARFWGRIERPPVKAEEWFKALRYNSMLSGPRTVEINIVGNALEIPWRIGRETAASALSGRPMGSQEVKHQLVGLAVGARKGSKAIMEVIANGISTEQALRGDMPRDISSRVGTPEAKAAARAIKNPIKRGVALAFNTGAAKGAAVTLESVMRLSGGVDEMARQMAYSMGLHRQAAVRASKEGLTGKAWTERVVDLTANPDKGLTEAAMHIADRMTFKGDMGPIGEILRRVQKVPYAGNILIPFLPTVYHITTRGIDRSPVGFVGTAFDVMRGAYKDGATPKGMAPLGERVGDNLIGFAIGTYFIHEAFDGKISGAGPDDPEKKAMLRAEGWQPFSVKLGDHWVSYSNWGPMAVSLSMAAAIAEAQQYKKPDDNALATGADTFRRFAEIVTEQAYLQGIGNLYRAINEPERYAGQFLTGLPQTFIPFGSFVNTIGQAGDEVVRSPERFNVEQSLAARLPVARESVPAQQDILGRPVENMQQGGMAFQPFRASEARDEPVLRTFADARVDIGFPPKEVKDVRLTPAEQRRYQQLAGEHILKEATPLAAHKPFRTAPLDARQTRLRGILTTAREKATAGILAEIGIEEIRRRRKEAATP